MLKASMDEKEIKLFPSKSKFFLYILGALIMSFVSFHTVVFGSVDLKIVGIMGIFFFGGGFILLLFRFVKPSPALILNRSGILDNSAIVSPGYLKWEEISRMKIINYRGKRFLGILPKDIEINLSKQNLLKRILYQINLSSFGVPYIIAEQNIPLKLEPLISLINKFHHMEIEA